VGRSVCGVVILSVGVGAWGFVPWKRRCVAAVVDERRWRGVWRRALHFDVNLELVVNIEKGGGLEGVVCWQHRGDVSAVVWAGGRFDVSRFGYCRRGCEIELSDGEGEDGTKTGRPPWRWRESGGIGWGTPVLLGLM